VPARKLHYILNRLPGLPEGSFLNGFLRLREKLAPTPVLDLALLAPTRKKTPPEVLKNYPQGVNQSCFVFNIFSHHSSA
jgi:hypothetical protein